MSATHTATHASKYTQLLLEVESDVPLARQLEGVFVVLFELGGGRANVRQTDDGLERRRADLMYGTRMKLLVVAH